jgi:hypothetical protein
MAKVRVGRGILNRKTLFILGKEDARWNEREENFIEVREIKIAVGKVQCTIHLPRAVQVNTPQ